MAETWKTEAGGFFAAWVLIGIFVQVKNSAALGLQRQLWRGKDVDGEHHGRGCRHLPLCAERVGVVRNSGGNYLLNVFAAVFIQRRPCLVGFSMEGGARF